MLFLLFSCRLMNPMTSSSPSVGKSAIFIPFVVISFFCFRICWLYLLWSLLLFSFRSLKFIRFGLVVLPAWISPLGRPGSLAFTLMTQDSTNIFVSSKKLNPFLQLKVQLPIRSKNLTYLVLNCLIMVADYNHLIKQQTTVLRI